MTTVSKNTAEQKRALRQAVRAHCAERYRDLFDRPWSPSTAETLRVWQDRSNQQERDAFVAFSALQKAARELRLFYRKHPASNTMAIPDELGDETSAWSNHGGLLHTIERHLEPVFRFPWLWDTKRRAFVWDARGRIVTLFDHEYNEGALKCRSSSKSATATPTRLTSTELAWISILSGVWPGIDITPSKEWLPTAVVREESKHIDDARRRREKFRRHADEIAKAALEALER